MRMMMMVVMRRMIIMIDSNDNDHVMCFSHDDSGCNSNGCYSVLVVMIMMRW